MVEEQVSNEATEDKYGPTDVQVVIVTNKGYAMRTTLGEFRLGRRKTTGVQAIKIGKGDEEDNDKNDRGTVVACKKIKEGDLLFIVTKKGVGALIDSSLIRLTGRKKAGVTLMKLEDGDEIVTVD